MSSFPLDVFDEYSISCGKWYNCRAVGLKLQRNESTRGHIVLQVMLRLVKPRDHPGYLSVSPNRTVILVTNVELR